LSPHRLRTAERPYPSSAFEAVICLWSAFYELLEEEEQKEAISEMWRVLRPGGFALIERPLYVEPSEEDIRTGTRRGPENRSRGASSKAS